MLLQLHKRENFIMSEPFHRLLVWKIQTSNYQILQVPITSKFIISTNKELYKFTKVSGKLI